MLRLKIAGEAIQDIRQGAGKLGTAAARVEAANDKMSAQLDS